MQSPTNVPRVTTAFILAAFMAVFTVPIGNCVSIFLGIADGSCSASIIGYAVFGLILVPPAIILFAVPCFLFFLKKGWLRLWQISLAGAAIGLLMAVLLSMLSEYTIWYEVSTFTVPLGLLCGAIFWLVAFTGNANRK